MSLISDYQELSYYDEETASKTKLGIFTYHRVIGNRHNISQCEFPSKENAGNNHFLRVPDNNFWDIWELSVIVLLPKPGYIKLSTKE